MKTTLVIAMGLLAGTAAAAESSAGWKPLLDAKLSQFDLYLSYPGEVILDVIAGKAPPDLKPLGLNPPGQTVFSVIEQDGKPVLRITGEIYGCAVTRESFENYHLRLETKWGDTKLVPRVDDWLRFDEGVRRTGSGRFERRVKKPACGAADIEARQHGAEQAPPPRRAWSHLKITGVPDLTSVASRAASQLVSRTHPWDCAWPTRDGSGVP